jgi:hypothetical protein
LIILENKKKTNIRIVPIKKELLSVVINGEKHKLLLSKDAQPKFEQFIDNKINEFNKTLINQLPKKRKGEEIGELKRITLQNEDFDFIKHIKPKEKNEYGKIATIYSNLIYDNKKYDYDNKKYVTTHAKIRITQDAKNLYNAGIDNVIKTAINEITSTFERNGKLKRVHIYPEDIHLD